MKALWSNLSASGGEVLIRYVLMSWERKLAEFFERLEAQRRVRSLREIKKVEGARALCADSKWRVVFCSNDYLGLKQHPKVVEAARRAADEWGAGSGASRLITGSLSIHARLEEKVCEWLGYEAAVLFGSGYLANVGTIEALGSAVAEAIVSDELNHASIIDGCRLARASTRIYRHLDVAHAGSLLSEVDGPALVVTESVFSMEGDSPDVAELGRVAAGRGALLFVDEAHALGLYGEGGRGLCAASGMRPELLLGTLGKALGSYGAFVATTSELKRFLVNRARTFIFATAPAPPAAAAAIAAMDLVARGEAPVKILWDNVRYFRGAAHAAGLPVDASGGAIVPIVVGSEQNALALSEYLWERGLWVQAIRPPTVPEGRCRLRITLSALHSRADMDLLVEALAGGLELVRNE